MGEAIDARELEVRRMSIREFREKGFLQEVNRRFFHPLGLALEVVIEDDGSERLGAIWDYRDDPEGMLFGDLTRPESREKADYVERLWDEKAKVRVEQYGFVVQPIGSAIKR